MEERAAYEEEAGKDEDPENASENHVTSLGGVEGLQLLLGDSAQHSPSTSGFNICVILLPNL